ncbi:MAG: OmpH family outer membrane protein [Alphaproteobacteria bacterium]|nr:OmpH family outer membrane protein [Alphaproteobacteria bacterium]
MMISILSLTRFRGIPALLAAVVLTLTGPALAQQQPARPAAPQAAPATPAVTSVGIVDMQWLFRESAAGKSASQQLADLRVRYENEVAKLEERLRVENNELERARASMSPEQVDAKRRELQRRVQETQGIVQQRNSAYDQAQRQAREQILRVIQQVVEQIMKERGFTVILDQAQVLLMDASLNISEEAMRRLDQRLPSVRVQAGGAAPGAATGGAAPAQPRR